MDSSSRSKPIVDRRHVSRPDVPILETGDLPADDDWALMKSFDVEQDDIDNTELDTGQITISSGAFD